MEMERKFDYALEACVGVVKNLRADDLSPWLLLTARWKSFFPWEKLRINKGYVRS